MAVRDDSDCGLVREVGTIPAISKSTGQKDEHTHELEKQIDSWNIHRSCHVAGDVCPAQRRSAAGRLFGAVSHDGGRLGDFCAAFRETEITRATLSASQRHSSAINCAYHWA